MTRGVQQGEENVRRLGVYLDSLKAWKCGLPARDGRPNLSVIAAACGFDRGVFYSNQSAKRYLDDAYRELGLDEGRAAEDQSAFDVARLKEEGKARVDARTRGLEEELLRLRAENARLRSENERYRAIRILASDTGRLP